MHEGVLGHDGALVEVESAHLRSSIVEEPASRSDMWLAISPYLEVRSLRRECPPAVRTGRWCLLC